VEELSKTYRVLLVDLHGQGESGAPDDYFTLDDMTGDVERALEALDAGQVCYLGHSMGGMVGMRLALQHPDRVGALVLMNTSAEAEPPPVQDLYHSVNEGSRGKPSNEATVGFLMNLMFSREFRNACPERVASYEHQLFNPPNPEGVYFAAHAVIWREEILEALQGLKLPTLVVGAQEDSSVPLKHQEQIAAHLPGAHLAVIEACGHMAPVEQPEELIGHLRDFLDTWWSAV
jgi:3-oxoadipate enol-lactonase